MPSWKKEKKSPCSHVPLLFHIDWSHEREVVLEHSIALHKIVLN